MRGDSTLAYAHAEASVRHFRRAGDHWGLGVALAELGLATLRLGDPARARRTVEESQAVFRGVGDR